MCTICHPTIMSLQDSIVKCFCYLDRYCSRNGGLPYASHADAHYFESPGRGLQPHQSMLLLCTQIVNSAPQHCSKIWSFSAGVCQHYFNRIFILDGDRSERFICHMNSDGFTLSCVGYFRHQDDSKSHFAYIDKINKLNRQWNTIRKALRNQQVGLKRQL